MLSKTLQHLIAPNFKEEELEKIVKNYFNLNSVSLGDIYLAPRSHKIGDSYLSNIIRFTINASGIDHSGDLKHVSVNVIAKVLPQNLARQKTFRSKDFFENEVIFYDRVWESMRKFYESKNMDPEFIQIVPKLLAYCLDGEHDYICLEDLSYKGYTSIERGDGIDHSNTVKVMDLFAKFHSLSLAFKDQKPKEFEEAASCLKETYFSEKYFSWYGNLQHSLFELVRDAVRRELPEEYYYKIDDIFKNNFYKKTCDICENNHSHLSGITQGDAWIPNFLFKTSSVALIDFQLARWAPISNDITFFMLTCVTTEVLREGWDEFINEYATKLKFYLRLLGSSPDLFSIEELKTDIKKNIVFAIAMSIEALPMTLIDGINVDLIEGDEAVPLESVWVMCPFEDEKRRQRVANMIKLLVDRQLI